MLGVPNVPPLSPPQLLDGSQLLVGGERWAQPAQHGAAYQGSQFHVHSRTDNLAAGVPAQYLGQQQPGGPAFGAGGGAGAIYTLGSGDDRRRCCRQSRTMPAACGITEEEEERRRLVAQVLHLPRPCPPHPRPCPDPSHGHRPQARLA